MTRVNAFGLRLSITALALLGVIALTFLVWYPSHYASIAGVGRLLLILVAINLIIGPGLSALIYRPGKKGLWFDLSVLGTVELVALVWAVTAIYERRPVYTVFAVDRFEAVTSAEIDRTAISYEHLLHRPGHEPRLVYAAMPTDPKAHERLIDEVLFLGASDIDRRPEFWKPYAAGVAAIKRSSRPLAELLDADDRRAGPVRRWLDHRTGAAEDYRFLPLRGRLKDATIILHGDIGYPVDILDVDPW